MQKYKVTLFVMSHMNTRLYNITLTVIMISYKAGRTHDVPMLQHIILKCVWHNFVVCGVKD